MADRIAHPSPSSKEGVKKSIQFFFTSFRRKPESSVFKVLRTYWTPVFTGVTAENQFFHSFKAWRGKSFQGGIFISVPSLVINPYNNQID
jgi:hypothetical protein